jgi:hypothetical protein
MNLIIVPKRNSPMRITITPAISVAVASPSYPWWWAIPATIGMNAAVGPPICTRLPPSAEMRNPATTAV